MAHMDTMLKNLGLPYERIAAVDGSKLTAAERKADYSPFWFGFFHGRQISPGELGCALTHRIAYRRIIDEDLDWALILEDDGILLEEFAAKAGTLLEKANTFDVIQLFYSENRYHRLLPVDKVGAAEICRFTGPHASAMAYIVRKSGATKLLRARRVVLTADKFSWMSALWGVSFCTVKPFMAVEEKSLVIASTIDGSDATVRHRGRINMKNSVWKTLIRPLLVTARSGLNALRSRI